MTIIAVCSAGTPLIVHHTLKEESWGFELSGIDKVDLLDLHNAARETKNIKPLTMHVDLDGCAQAHAEWMALHNSMSHEENIRDMHEVGDRLTKYRNWNTCGENIAYGQDSPTMVTNAWMDSHGHRLNILNKNFNNVGFGIATSDTGDVYWCTVFSD